MDTTKPAYDVRNHEAVSHEDWARARTALLAKEKEFTKARDALSQARRDLPWERVEKTYVFDGSDGKKTLAEAFNRDLGVTFTDDEIETGRAPYNYTLQAFPDNEAPGASVFFKAANGNVYHTYSTYGRGIDILNGAYNYIDLAPKGRDEGDTTQRWVRRHDEYTG